MILIMQWVKVGKERRRWLEACAKDEMKLFRFRVNGRYEITKAGKLFLIFLLRQPLAE